MLTPEQTNPAWRETITRELSKFSPQEVAAKSLKNWHATGLTNIWLPIVESLGGKVARAKLYLFEGEAAAPKQVVNPHDHIYAFETHVIAGEVTDSLYEVQKTVVNPFKHVTYEGAAISRTNGRSDLHPQGRTVRAFEWLSPMASESRTPRTATIGLHTISERYRQTYAEGQGFYRTADDIHTLTLDEGPAAVVQFEAPARKVTNRLFLLDGTTQPQCSPVAYQTMNARELSLALKHLGIKPWGTQAVNRAA